MPPFERPPENTQEGDGNVFRFEKTVDDVLSQLFKEELNGVSSLSGREHSLLFSKLVKNEGLKRITLAELNAFLDKRGVTYPKVEAVPVAAEESVSSLNVENASVPPFDQKAFLAQNDKDPRYLVPDESNPGGMKYED